MAAVTERMLPAPAPNVLPEVKPFWDATAEGRLVLPQCVECQTLVWYPRPFCPACGSLKVSWIAASGRGTVYSYTVIRQNFSRSFRHLIPYVVALVDLEEGPRLMTNIVGCEPADVSVGMPVQVRFERVSDDASLPVFTPRD